MAKKRAGGNRRVTGGHIRSWRKAAFEELPNGTNEDIAARVNALAGKAGFAGYAVGPDQVDKWRSAPAPAKPGRKARQVTTANSRGEGQVIPVLRQLVQLVGKEEVKRIVDGL